MNKLLWCASILVLSMCTFSCPGYDKWLICYIFAGMVCCRFQTSRVPWLPGIRHSDAGKTFNSTERYSRTRVSSSNSFCSFQVISLIQTGNSPSADTLRNAGKRTWKHGRNVGFDLRMCMYITVWVDPLFIFCFFLTAEAENISPPVMEGLDEMLWV
jgi:hypothetical protein